jgi:hypothetical protein
MKSLVKVTMLIALFPALTACVHEHVHRSYYGGPGNGYYKNSGYRNPNYRSPGNVNNYYYPSKRRHHHHDDD